MEAKKGMKGERIKSRQREAEEEESDMEGGGKRKVIEKRQS